MREILLFAPSFTLQHSSLRAIPGEAAAKGPVPFMLLLRPSLAPARSPSAPVCPQTPCSSRRYPHPHHARSHFPPHPHHLVVHPHSLAVQHSHRNTAQVSGGERELRTNYLKPFNRACVEAFSIMTAYSSYDGIPAIANKREDLYLLRTRLMLTR